MSPSGPSAQYGPRRQIVHADSAPPGWPVPRLAPRQAVVRAFRQYAQFDGRASRREFWYFSLFCVLVEIVLLVPAVAISRATATSADEPGPAAVVGSVLLLVFALATALPTIALACRRLHDAGLSGLYLLIGLVTTIVPLVMCALPTSPDASRFGPPGRAGGA